MTRWLRAVLPPFLVALGLPLAILAAPTVALAGDPCYHGFQMPATTVSTTPHVKAEPCAFGPTIVSVPVGSTVTWSNDTGQPHLVTGANQAWGSRDDELPVGGTVSYTFDTAGVYPYACALHVGMVGAVVVGGDAAAVLPPPAVNGTGPAKATAASTTPATATAPDEGQRIALAAAAGALIALAVAWIVRGMRRPVRVREIGPSDRQA